MIYAAFSLWLVLILFAGTGVYRLWTTSPKSAWVDWVVLPGTIVSEMAYIFGCLITGGEIRRAKLMPQGAGQSGKGAGAPAAEASPNVRRLAAVVAALVSIVACAAAILAADALLGEPVIRQFATGNGLLPPAALPKTLPTGWEEFWAQATGQVWLLRRMCETLRRVSWLDWRVPLFIYLSLCLAVRLSPVRRAIRPTLAAVVAIAAAIGLLGLIWPRFSSLMQNLWPLLTYVWASLLLTLVVTLLVHGVGALVHILSGKPAK